MRTVEEIRNQIKALEAELAAIEGKPITIQDCEGRELADRPEGGAILEERWCTDYAATISWYPTTEAAKAALLSIARGKGRAPADHGCYVNLTVPGCHPSWAQVTA